METKKRSLIEKGIAIFLFLILVILVLFGRQIINYLMVNMIYKREIVVLDANQYQKQNDFAFVQTTTNFSPETRTDIINIIYTVLNNGWNNFTFYCDYENCIQDVNDITSDNYLLSNINNFVHPYNSFNRIYVTTNNFGKVNIKIERLYSENEIEAINQKVEEIWNSQIDETMKVEEKIRVIHDYIINHAVYDIDRANIIENGLDDSNPKYQSHIAYGPLIEGYAICGGYSDAMAIFLYKMGVPNYKISSENHVWNFVKLDDKWYHLDLTWDDPVILTGENLLIHNFFLIDTQELANKQTEQHLFEKQIYIEAQ